MKVKHSPLTKRILADQPARESFIRWMSTGRRKGPITLTGRNYFLVPSWTLRGWK